MVRPFQGRRIARAVILLFVAFAGTSCLWRSASGPMPSDSQADKYEYHAKLLAQEEAAPGKVIRATEDGRELAAYVCAPEDAAVALVSLESDNPDTKVKLTTGQAVDSSGDRYSVTVRQEGSLYFIVLERGFPTRPDKVSMKATFSLPTHPSGETVASTQINFTRIAAPARVVVPLTGAALKAAERMAVAEYAENPGVLGVKLAPKVIGTPTILATAYSPAGRPQAKGMGFPRANTTYDDRTDAVKVRIDHARLVSSDFDVTYRNAKIVERDGKRVLWLPETETIGALNGCPATVNGFNEFTYRGIHYKHSQGIFAVKLGDQATGFPTVVPTELHCLGVTPSVDQLGLDWLEVNVPNYVFSEMLKGSPGQKPPFVTDVPELTLHFRVTHQEKVSSEIVSLPVHRIAEDPAIGIPRPVGLPARSGTVQSR